MDFMKQNFDGLKDIQRCMRWLIITLYVTTALFVIYLFNSKGTARDVYIPPLKGLADSAKYTSSLCAEKFNATFEDNLNIIKNYPVGNADDFLWKIGGNLTSPEKMRPFPVFVTAFDKKYYPQSQGLFRSLHTLFAFNPKYGKDVHIVVYDLGMSVRQLNVLKAKCRCEIRTFPFDDFPKHVRHLKTYAFKPIIVHQTLLEFGYVWWVDSSVRFTTPNIDKALEYATRNSVLYTVTTSPLTDFSIVKQTDARTFQFFGEDVCKFRPYGEIWATTVLFHYDEVTMYVVRAWAACALNRDCIAPVGTAEKIFCYEENTEDGRCHRFDQSVLGIIMYRLYHDYDRYPTDLSLNDIYEIRRGHIANYFESCRILALCM